MAHHVYNTEGFILDSAPSGEASKRYTLFTKDLGMVRAVAQGVRLSKSKLRFSLQDFSLVHVSLVRGKEVWRLTNARSEKNLYSYFKHDRRALSLIVQIFSLTKRLIPGEEKNEELFTILHDAFEFLDAGQLSNEEKSSFELILVIKILENLGYMGNSVELRSFIVEPWSKELLQDMERVKKIAYREINTSLKETQL